MNKQYKQIFRALKTALILGLTLSPISMSFAEDLSRETLGEVRVGVPFTNILRAFGSPVKSSKALADAQRGCTAQVHYYEKRGVEVEVCGSGRSALVSSVRVVKDKTPVTGRGIRVGDSLEKIIARYGNARKTSGAVVIEDRAIGVTLRFLLESGRVYEISLYKDHTQKAAKIPKIRKKRTPKMGW